MATFPFALISPDRNAFEGQVNEVLLSTAGGEMGILAGHVPYIGAVRICDCTVVREDTSTVHLAVRGGFVEVDPAGAVTLLADIVLRPDEIDVNEVQAERDAAASPTAPAPAAGEDEESAYAAAQAEAAAAWVQVRLEVATAGGAAASAPHGA